MDPYPLVVLANEPESYRSLLAAELPFLRPNLRVLEVHPDQLDAAVIIYHPALVLCSRALAQVPVSACSVLLLCTEEIDAFLQFGSETIVNPRLSDILHAIDRALLPEPPGGLEEPRSGPALPATTPLLDPLQTA